MSHINSAFCGILLKNAKRDLLKVLPYSAIKGTWTYRYELGNVTYEVHIPKNETFPNGYYYHRQVDNASEAKADMFSEILERIAEENVNCKNWPIVVTSEQIEKAKQIVENDQEDKLNKNQKDKVELPNQELSKEEIDEIDELLDTHMLDDTITNQMKEKYPDGFYLENLRSLYSIPSVLAEGIVKLMMNSDVISEYICFLCPICKIILGGFTPEELDNMDKKERKDIILTCFSCEEYVDMDLKDTEKIEGKYRYSLSELRVWKRYKWIKR